jgi:cysteine desulfurase/selenocysteine lyase
MIAEGQVSPEHVAYNDLPWKYTAGTPNILGTIASAQALRLLIDLTGADTTGYFGTDTALPRPVIDEAMHRIARHTSTLTAHAMLSLQAIDGITIYGPPVCAPRAPLVAFNINGLSPFTIAEELDRLGVESRAGCHCATLAHHALHLNPPASCRLSFSLYNTLDEIDRAVQAVARIAAAAR